jgi:hypothetical protein
LAVACGSSIARHISSAGPRSNGSTLIWYEPASILETSRMAFTTESRWLPASPISVTCSFCLPVISPEISRCSSMSEKPMIALSGVRSSWLTAAREAALGDLGRVGLLQRARQFVAQRRSLLPVADQRHHRTVGRGAHDLDVEGAIAAAFSAGNARHPKTDRAARCLSFVARLCDRAHERDAVRHVNSIEQPGGEKQFGLQSHDCGGLRRSAFNLAIAGDTHHQRVEARFGQSFGVAFARIRHGLGLLQPAQAQRRRIERRGKPQPVGRPRRCAVEQEASTDGCGKGKATGLECGLARAAYPVGFHRQCDEKNRERPGKTACERDERASEQCARGESHRLRPVASSARTDEISHQPARAEHGAQHGKARRRTVMRHHGLDDGGSCHEWPRQQRGKKPALALALATGYRRMDKTLASRGHSGQPIARSGCHCTQLNALAQRPLCGSNSLKPTLAPAV